MTTLLRAIADEGIPLITCRVRTASLQLSSNVQGSGRAHATHMMGYTFYKHHAVYVFFRDFAESGDEFVGKD